MIKQGVDFQLRETAESAFVFGEAALRALGVADDTARAVSDDMRRRDAERLELQTLGDLCRSGRHRGCDRDWTR